MNNSKRSAVNGIAFQSEDPRDRSSGCRSGCKNAPPLADPGRGGGRRGAAFMGKEGRVEIGLESVGRCWVGRKYPRT